MQVQNFTASQLPRQVPPTGKGIYALAINKAKKQEQIFTKTTPRNR